MFKVGEFSRIAQVSPRLLRHYDEVGLFTPEHHDPHSGYRYYSARQLPTLHRILALRDLGLSLEQIGRLLHGRVDLAELRGMLQLKKQQLELSVREELQKLHSVEARLRQVEREGELTTDEVVLKQAPAQHLLSFRETFPSRAEGLAAMWECVTALPQRTGTEPLGPFTVVFHTTALEDENLDAELGFLTPGPLSSRSLPSGRQLAANVLQASPTVATVIREGWYDANLDCLTTLARWMDAHGYRFSGPLREVYIQPPVRGREHETIAELQWPVERVTPPPLPLN